MTDHLNPHRIYPDDISRHIDIAPGNDSIRSTYTGDLSDASIVQILTGLYDRMPCQTVLDNLERSAVLAAIDQVKGARDTVAPLLEQIAVMDARNGSLIDTHNSHVERINRALDELQKLDNPVTRRAARVLKGHYKSTKGKQEK